MRGTLGHEVLAGAIGGSAVAGGAVGGPLWATVCDVLSAAATATIATHAVAQGARAAGTSPAASTRLLHRAARDAAKNPGAPLAADAVDVLCRARSGDARALRSAAILVGRATTAHARGLALQIFGSWCAPLRELTQLGAPFAAARATLEAAEFVRTMTGLASQPVEAPIPGVPEEPWNEEAPPESGRFLVGTFGGGDSAESQERETPWEVAA